MYLIGALFQLLFAFALPVTSVGNTALVPAAERTSPPPVVRRVRSDEVGVAVTAKGAIVSDAASGDVLFQKNADQVQSIASLTKLMTALVVQEVGVSFDQEITIESADMRGGGVEHFIPGEVVRVRDLWFASLVSSSNTATAALVRATGISEELFVRRMNEKALRLGMVSAQFVEPTGLDTRNMASPRDVLVLVRTAFAMDAIRQAVTSEEYAVTPVVSKATSPRILRTTDQLLGTFLSEAPYAIRGGKTGSLGDDVGYHLAVAISRDGQQQIFVVVMGSSTPTERFQDAKALAVWTFDAHVWESTITNRD